jgi:SAM-dependent methyltransferase
MRESPDIFYHPADIEAYYRRLFLKFGGDPKSDGYSREIAREERYAMYARHFDFRGKTLIDVGCGTGKFIEYLVGAGIFPKRWVGIDLLPEKVVAAENRLRRSGFVRKCQDVGTQIRLVSGTVGNLDETADIVVACSIFDVKQTDVPTTFKLACSTLQEMWNRASFGIGADFFSPYALDIQPFNAPIPPEWMFTWARTSLSQRVILDNSYLPHDYSIIALKNDNRFVSEWKKCGGWKRETGGEAD